MRLLPLADLSDPGARSLAAEGEAIIVVRLGETVRGYLDRCPHTGQPLSPWPDRLLTKGGDRLICFGHGALFRLDDGVCTAGPCVNERLESVALRVEDGWVVATETPLPPAGEGGAHAEHGRVRDG